MKRCTRCKEYKEESEYNKNGHSADGLAYYCKPCTSEYNRLQHTLHKSKEGRSLIKSKRAGAWNKSPENKERRAFTNKAYRQRIRMEVIKAYGGKCECCGEPRREFLAIDHIEGGGNKHRKQLRRGGHGFHHWLRNNNYPSGFRILCHNCNSALGYYSRCPHNDSLPGFMSGAPWYEYRRPR